MYAKTMHSVYAILITSVEMQWTKLFMYVQVWPMEKSLETLFLENPLKI